MRASHLIAVFFVFSLFSSQAQSATITVTSTDDSGASTLRQAVLDASTGDVINFNVTGDTITLTSGQIEINKALTITGPGSDSLTIESSGPPNRVFYFSSGASSVSGLTIANGDTTGYTGGEGSSGGCIYNAVVLTLDDVTLQNCTAESGSNGGGIFTSQDLTMSHSTLDHNQADFGGGILSNGSINISLDDVVFSFNTAMSAGGGLYLNTSSALEVANSLFILNESTDGGGIFSFSSTINLSDSTLSSNTVSAFGGGIYGVNSTIDMDGAAMAGNSATFGGAIFMQGFPTASLSITRATLSNNTATSGVTAEGGGIYFDGASSTLALSNVTIADNQATGAGTAFGGGITVSQASATLNNVTIAGNSANTTGGGLSLTNGGTASVQNSILANNTASSEPDCSGSLTSLDYNLIENDSGCTISGSTDHNIIGDDPQLGDLQNNGGEYNTMALATTSPAVNAGNPETPGSGGASCAATDERGVSRPQGSACDIGAFELAPGLLGLSASTYSVAQDGSSVTITVQRTSDSDTFDGSVSVNYATSDGTAVAGTNYTATSGTLTWEAENDDPQTISIPILNANSTSDLTFNITLSEPTGDASLISPSAAVVTITGSGGGTLGGGDCSLSPHREKINLLPFALLFASLGFLYAFRKGNGNSSL